MAAAVASGLCCLTLFCLTLFPLTAVHAEARRALVIGIDDYEHENLLPDLRGAVNDARDLTETFIGLNFTRVETLLDRKATRARILAAWDELLAQSRPGDTLLVTYAGHGMQAPARLPDSESDGKDEFLPLATFDDRGPTRTELILDDEIAQWADRAAAKDVRMVLVVDACHSGTTFRAVDRRVRAITYRTGGEVLTDDLFGDFDLDSVTDSETEIPPNLLSFGAAIDEQKVPEVLLADNQGNAAPRGAMSFYFSRGLRGAADDDGNGSVTFAEMRDYLTRNIRQASNGAQTPNILAARDDTVLMRSASTRPPPLADRPLRLSVLNWNDDLPPLDGAELVFPGDPADLIWDSASREVIAGTDTVVAHNISAGRLQGVIDRHRAAQRLAALAEQRTLSVVVAPDRPRHRTGQALSLSVKDTGYPYRVVFAIDPDGRTALLYPITADEARPAPPDAPLSFDGIEVGGPIYGADLVVALAAEAPPTILIEALQKADEESMQTGRATAQDAVAAVGSGMRGNAYRLGTAAVYTCEEGTEGC